MGIQGLLPLLKSIQKPTHLRQFAGQTLGVDAYGWLHRGTAACAVELAEGKPTRKHIDFALHRVRMLIHFGVQPYIVFDGDYLPSKAHTEKERAARRKESKRVGLEMLRVGRPSQAQLELQKAVDVTPAMARELIEELKNLNVPYVVAPYEADSQLTYLEKKGYISGVLSEDSDLLVFGVQCLLTKLDQYGECVMINRADFTSCRDVSLVGWTDHEFRIMAMLSGCDYLPGIDKMGLKTAYRLVRKHKTVDRVVRTVQFDGKMRVPKGYLDDFSKAEKTFLYQWVFCPEAKGLVNLNKLPTGLKAENMLFIGKYVEPDHATGVACGDLDPNSKKPILLPQRLYHPASRQRTIPAPSEKPGKPIDEFFKPRRIPLAELDPNSFTPSPSQQHLLQSQESRSWSASQIPAPRVFSGRHSANAAPPSSAPHTSRRVATDPTISMRTASKRQRLCSDSSSIAAAMGGTNDIQTATSRFFAHPSAQPSPSLRKKSARDKAEEFDLWSDDSIAEAIAGTEAETPPTGVVNIKDGKAQSRRRKLDVFVDEAPETDATLEAAESQKTIATSASSTSTSFAKTSTQETALTSFGSTFSALSTGSVFSKGIRLDMEAMRHQPKTSTPRKSLSRTVSAPVLSRTPLRELGLVSTSIKSIERTPGIDDSGIVLESPAGATQDAFPSDVIEDGIEDGITENEWLAIEKQPLLLATANLLDVHGSEDLLVPESPEDRTSSDESKPKLDLSRFAFG